MKLSKTTYIKNLHKNYFRQLQCGSFPHVCKFTNNSRYGKNNLNNLYNILKVIYREISLSFGEIEAQFYLCGLVQQLGQRVVERHDGRGVLAKGRVVLH